MAHPERGGILPSEWGMPRAPPPSHIVIAIVITSAIVIISICYSLLLSSFAIITPDNGTVFGMSGFQIRQVI